MKFPTVLLALCLSVVTANASFVHGGAAHGHVARHASLAQRQPTLLEKKAEKKASTRRRCRARPTESSLTASSTSTSTTSKAASTTSSSSTSKKTTSSATKTSEAAKPTNDGNSGGGKTVNASGACGNSRAESKPSKLSGPNGHIDWLNCGIEGAGWNPPDINLGNVVYKDLDEAKAMPNSPFKACEPFIQKFKDYAKQHNIPAILIASFAMQESSCNPNTVGGGGEQGLMQITKEKCIDAPGGDCKEPDFNIRTGVAYFAGRLKDNGGNLLLAAGQYNGWRKGLTVGAATAARNSACCRCQNNLDYIHQLFNGWMQGVSAYSTDMTKYNNLAVCG
ncbi:glycoside hydrolase family 23 protein [Ephemerocybe angulata]|uniref:Glycoside hydrolase family 23 protein n=1 Tax=Ephemerocybe angulata TaxID=980116 RepID=A0A8H6I9P8_9AGAR|nr:glycoside hydrolase family 23 protein [Tulosesus angulatus]